ncbi:oligogalacturonide lyase [Pseudoduganella flava]|uniref:Oligogalacturonide lyase n=1 Tax=Pseudoduganella flava TaxID=871742 RepID=A0A562PVG5_9BURK|nr:oligogalacturonate lyase family protein [Pseudoduganella flava]TWI48378.1 oligogalacturonide lyase [Pseudoduganella flava]
MCYRLGRIIFAFFFFSFELQAAGATANNSWIDSQTGRHVIRISNEAFATLPYFTANIFTPDGGSMVYVSGRGLHLASLETFRTSLLVPVRNDELHCIEVGRVTGRVFYLSKSPGGSEVALRSVDPRSGAVVLHARLPGHYRIESINADETLAAGIREEPDPQRKPPSPNATKGELLYERVNAKIPMALFTVDLKSGAVRVIHESTDWLSHPQFSPADPEMLMYSHEGPWHQVDRIWTIRADGSGRRLVHHRTAPMEIAGHEFWSANGRAIHYDWQRPKAESFYLASFRLAESSRDAVVLTRQQWSIHFNASTDPALFVGDGADKDQVARSASSAGIFLYRLRAGDTQIFTEKLVDLSAHDYRLEPNARLTPDRQWAVFRSNLFGIPAVFAVRVDKKIPEGIAVRSTATFAREMQAERRKILMME